MAAALAGSGPGPGPGPGPVTVPVPGPSSASAWEGCCPSPFQSRLVKHDFAFYTFANLRSQHFSLHKPRVRAAIRLNTLRLGRWFNIRLLGRAKVQWVRAQLLAGRSCSSSCAATRKCLPHFESGGLCCVHGARDKRANINDNAFEHMPAVCPMASLKCR